MLHSFIVLVSIPSQLACKNTFLLKDKNVIKIFQINITKFLKQIINYTSW